MSWRPAERVALVLLLLAFFFCGYYAVGLTVDPARAHSLRVPLDDVVPFWPASVHAYALVYTAALFPAFSVRAPDLFRRVALAYAVVIAVSLACFAVFPVTAQGLRPSLDGLDPARFETWGLRLAYALDPPVNLFPSIHLAIAVLAALCSGKARPLYGGLAFAAVVPMAVSICAVKQHYAVDGLAGAALAAAAYAGLVHPWRGPEGRERAFGWRGPAAYLGLHALVYCGLYGAFVGGIAP